MKNFTIPLGLTAANSHSGSLDQSPARVAQIMAFGRPMSSSARPAHDQRGVTVRCASNACGMVRCLLVFRWVIGDEVLTYTFYI
jgi:hypothetical protein